MILTLSHYTHNKNITNYWNHNKQTTIIDYSTIPILTKSTKSNTKSTTTYKSTKLKYYSIIKILIYKTTNTINKKHYWLTYKTTIYITYKHKSKNTIKITPPKHSPHIYLFLYTDNFNTNNRLSKHY